MAKISSEQMDMLRGRNIRLRAVTDDDAQLMIDLRSSPELTRFLPPLETSLEKQKKWISSLSDRTDDFMFALETHDGGHTEGYIGVYAINNLEAEWGRWVMRVSTPAALESVLLLHRFAFDVLKLKRIYCRTIVENEKVVAFHDKYGARRVGVIGSAIKIGEKDFDVIEHEITEDLWPQIWGKFSRIVTPKP